MTTCDYENNGTTITQPGKFEGEPVFTPHFWQLGMEGFADEDSGSVFKFKFTKEELKHQPLLKDWLGTRRTLFLWEDSQGFVHCR